jgi:hypothetical protein
MNAVVLSGNYTFDLKFQIFYPKDGHRVVRIMVNLWDRGSEVRMPAGLSIFLFSKRRSVSRVHPALFSMGTGTYFPWGRVAEVGG